MKFTPGGLNLTGKFTFGPPQHLVEDQIIWGTPSGSLGSFYGGDYASVSLSASNLYETSVTYAVVSGSLPAGLSLSSSGVISGTVTNVGGLASFSVRASSATAFADRGFTILVTQDVVSWSTAAGSLGSYYGGGTVNVSLSASSNAGYNVTYSLQSGSLPSGVNLSGNQILGTMPDADATYNFTIRASDGITYTDRAFSLTGTKVVVTWSTSASLPTKFVGQTASSNFSASANSGRSITYSVVSGTVPPTTSISSAGAWTGTFTSAGSYNFTVRASDGVGFADRAFSSTVSTPTITWVTASGSLGNLAGGTVGYSTSVSATTNTGLTVSYSLLSGSLPPNLSLNTSTGAITGSLTNTSGTYNFTARAADALASADRSFSFTVTQDVVSWLTSTLDPASENVAYSMNLVATTTVSRSITYSLISGTLPAGLSLSSAGILSGTPTGYGSYDITVRATTGISSADQNFTLSVNAAPQWSTPSGSVGTFAQNEDFVINLSATDDGTFTYTVVSSDLPADTTTLSIVGNTAVVAGYVASQDPSAPVWSTTAGTLGTVNRLANVSISLAATANTSVGRSLARYTTRGSSLLPAGLALDQSTGVISGFPDLWPKDANEPEVSISNPPTWSTSAGSLGTLNENTSFSTTLSASATSGRTMSSYLVVSGNLPFGLALATSTGVLSGTTDDIMATESEVRVTPQPTFTSASNGTVSLGTIANGATITNANTAASLANATITYIVYNGTLPFGTTVLSNGAISGTVEAFNSNSNTTANALPSYTTKNFAFTLRAIANTGAYADQAFSFTVTP